MHDAKMMHKHGKAKKGSSLGMLQTPPLEGIAPRDSQDEEKKDGYSERS